MFSRSDTSFLGRAVDQPQIIPTQVTPIQLVPVLPQLYPTDVRLVQMPRMPVTVLSPPPLSVSLPPPTTLVGQQPHTVNTTDATMQMFAERAVKSGIRLEALPETSTNTKAEKQARVGQSCLAYAVTSSLTAGIQTQASSLSALNIGCPEFVPRSQNSVFSQMTFQHQSNTVPLESHVHGFGNPASHPIMPANGRIGRVVAAPYDSCDTLVNSAHGTSVYDKAYSNGDGTFSTANDLSEQFANIDVGHLPRPLRPRMWHAQAQDASTQTINAKMVNACTGNSSLLMVDACTNTPQYDETRDLQSPELAGIDSRVQSIVASPSNRWADCWQQGQSPGSVANDEKSSCLFSDASKDVSPNLASSSASRCPSSSFHFSQAYDTVPKSLQNVNHVDDLCECGFTDCPLASSASPLDCRNRNALQTHSADLPSSLYATMDHSGQMLPSREDGKLRVEDLSEEVYVYYSSDEDVDDLLLGDTAITVMSGAKSSANPQPTEMCQDHTTLLAQLTSGGLPSQATIELAVSQLMEAITADEKQLMTQLLQQMVIMSPVIAAASPLALQVEAIRIVLTTRAQRALVPGVSGLQQTEVQAQLQNFSRSDASAGTTVAAQSESAAAQAEPTPVAAAAESQEGKPHVPQMSKPRDHRSSDESSHWASVASVVDDGGSVLSDHTQPGATRRLAGGRGRGIYATRLAADNEVPRQDRSHGRGVGRGRTGTETNMLPGNCKPLIPPPLHIAQSADEPAVNNSAENWEDEIDPFGTEVFSIKPSLSKSRKK